MSQNWYRFTGAKCGGKNPPVKRYVLVQIAAGKTSTGVGMPPSVAVGYLKRISTGPFFVVPGFGREFTVTHWCDCLGDTFHPPLWESGQDGTYRKVKP